MTAPARVGLCVAAGVRPRLSLVPGGSAPEAAPVPEHSLMPYARMLAGAGKTALQVAQWDPHWRDPVRHDPPVRALSGLVAGCRGEVFSLVPVLAASNPCPEPGPPCSRDLHAVGGEDR
jgi:hypothetical protein